MRWASGPAATSSGQPVKTATAAAQLAAVTLAVETARAAVDALDDASTDAEVAATEKAVTAANTAVEDADALSGDVKGAYRTALAVIEESLARARAVIAAARAAGRKAAAAAVGQLLASLRGVDRITAIGAIVKHGAAPVMAGTVPGTTATAVTGLETAAVAGSAAAVGEWAGGTYTAADEDAETTDTVVLYTDIEPTGTQPFSGDGGKYGNANGLDGDGNLPIVSATDASLITSAAFPLAPGIRTHEAGDDGTVSVAGTFDGAQGRYVCTPAAESGCTSSIRQGGGFTLSGGGGGWKFVPAADAMVAKPDTEYRYFGWWLRDTGEGYAIGAFHGGAGDAADEFANLPALQGTVRYRGPAAGKYALEPLIGEASSGDFTATAALEADFGDGTAAGTVEGTVDTFMVDGTAMPWSVELQAAGIGAHGAIGASGTNAALTEWTIGEREGAALASDAPAWAGRFHAAGDDRVPAVATGTFEATYGEVGRMIGAFGTTRQQ